jgi:hypothetical protein
MRLPLLLQTEDMEMNLSPAETELQERFLKVLLEATFSLQAVGPDRETTLLALMRATEMLKERFEQELDELRQEKD